MNRFKRLPVLVEKKYQEKIKENRRSQKERRTNPKNLKEKLEKPVKQKGVYESDKIFHDNISSIKTN